MLAIADRDENILTYILNCASVCTLLRSVGVVVVVVFNNYEL